MQSIIVPSVPALSDWIIFTLCDSTSWFYVALTIFIIIKFLKCFSEPEVPRVFVGDRAGQIGKVLRLVPQLECM